MSHEKVCKIKIFVPSVKDIIPSEKDNILKFDQYRKSDKMPCIIYTDMESFIKK